MYIVQGFSFFLPAIQKVQRLLAIGIRGISIDSYLAWGKLVPAFIYICKFLFRSFVSFTLLLLFYSKKECLSCLLYLFYYWLNCPVEQPRRRQVKVQVTMSTSTPNEQTPFGHQMLKHFLFSPENTNLNHGTHPHPYRTPPPQP